MVLKRTEMFVFVVGHYARSPWIRLASSMSFGMMVTRLAWMAHRLASSNSLTRYASTTSWRHSIVTDWNHRSVLKSWSISLTNLCCDIGQIDIFSRIELFPLSSCQVIILIARMTFNCSTSCLMS